MAHVSESCIDCMNAISRRRRWWNLGVVVTPSQCLINASNPRSHNTVDGGEDNKLRGLMMRRWMQTQATALPLKILRISGLTKK